MLKVQTELLSQLHSVSYTEILSIMCPCKEEGKSHFGRGMIKFILLVRSHHMSQLQINGFPLIALQ